MIETIVTVVGAAQLARCFIALIETLEKPSAPPAKAKRREP